MIIYESRPPIPACVARALRAEAGYGCCVCGKPVYQYHHIVPWSTENHYRQNDMMLLCPEHHDQATKGVLKEAKQRRHKLHPHNIKHGLSKGHLEVGQSSRHVLLGSINLDVDGPFILVDDEPILGFSISEEGIFEISLSLFDQADNRLVEIDRNHWKTSGDSWPWDIESDWHRLKIREKHRRVSFSFDASETLTQ